MSSNDDENWNWTHDLNELQEVGEEILHEWRDQEPNSPRDYPTIRWLAKNGYSHLRWVLREKHDMNTAEFFILLTSSGGESKYEWGIDVATVSLVKRYLADQAECRDWSPETKRTVRSRIKTALNRFDKKYPGKKIVAHANDPDCQQEFYEGFKQVIKSLREDLSSDESAHKYLRAVHRFIEWLERSGRIEKDPIADLEEEFRWNISHTTTLLTPEQVRQLWTTAETDEERILVIGFCVWGVRTQELPAVSIDQIDLSGSNPVIRFEDEDRKNESGEVSLLFGLDSFVRLIDKRSRKTNWNGYLFPSSDDNRLFLCANQAREKFKTLCRRANVTVEGEVATPKHGRSFYYNIMSDAEADLLEMAAEIAKEQGAKDPASVRDYYLTTERRRRYRRIFFRRRLRKILPDDAYACRSSGIDRSLDEFR